MLSGKGFWIWKAINCEGGDLEAIVAKAVSAHLKHVFIKIADGVIDYNVSVDLPRLFSLFEAAGIDVWGWQYLYGSYPEQEARKAISQIRKLNPKGFVIDAEGEFKAVGGNIRAARYMKVLREAFPELSMGLSSYRYPSYHREFPWKEFLQDVDFNMPQVYWMHATNAGAQLRRSVGDFELLYAKLGVRVPIIPTGAAFAEHGWTTQPSEILDFLTVAKEMQFPAVTFWEWSDARHRYPELFDTVSNFIWDEGTVDPIPQTLEERVESLERRVLRLENGAA